MLAKTEEMLIKSLIVYPHGWESEGMGLNPSSHLLATFDPRWPNNKNSQPQCAFRE